MKRGAWQAIVHRVTKSRIRLKRLSMHTCMNSNGRQNIFKHTGNNYLDFKEKSDRRDWNTLGYVNHAKDCIFCNFLCLFNFTL